MSGSDRPEGPEPTFLRRWSQRKLAAARTAEAERPADSASASPAPAGPAATAAPAAPATEAAAEVRPDEPETPALPDVGSLTFDSDFRAFLSPKVDEATQRAALRKLFADPRFNAMDGLDVYIDDYSKFEPVVPEVLKQLRHARYLFDPPKTRVNEAGHVEDIPDEDATAAAADDRVDDTGTAPSTGPIGAKGDTGDGVGRVPGPGHPEADDLSPASGDAAAPSLDPAADAGGIPQPAPPKVRSPR